MNLQEVAAFSCGLKLCCSMLAQSYIFRDLDCEKTDLFFCHSNMYFCFWYVILRRYVWLSQKSVYVLNSCWMMKYLCEFSCLSMHRCVEKGHTDMCNYLHTQSAYEIHQNLSGSSVLLFLEFCTPGCHNLKRKQTFTFTYDWASHSHKFATWSGKLLQTRSLARLQWT